MGYALLAVLSISCQGGSESRVTPKKIAPGRDTVANALGKPKEPLTSVITDSITRVALEPKAGEEKFLPLSDEESVTFFKQNCTSCHAPGKPLHAAWQMPADDKFNMAFLETSSMTSTVYQVLSNKVKPGSENAYPSPMPPSPVDEAGIRKIKSLLAWMEQKFPGAHHEAQIKFNSKSQYSSATEVNFKFQCTTPMTGTEYLTKLFSEALGSPPSPTDISTLLPNEMERTSPTTPELRARLAAALLSPTGTYLAGFKASGLKAFARNVAGTGGELKMGDQVRAPELADIRDEFYELLKKYMDTLSYKEILELNKVMVTTNTAKLYKDCTYPAGTTDKYIECTLPPERSNFFGTVGFLLSKPSSFLESNNNYGRGGEMHAVMSGERLSANTEGPAGEQPRPIPTCFTTNDKRWKLPDVPANVDVNDKTKRAPWGAISVPEQGRICQSCHLNRHLAAASFVFRPFGLFGEVITPQAILTADPAVGNAQNRGIYYAPLKAAVDTKHVNLPANTAVPLTAQFFADLLRENESTTQSYICAPAADSTTQDFPIKNIGDLTKVILGDGAVLARGLARYVPKAISNSNSTNLEIMTKMYDAYNRGSGKLGPVFEAYFSSDTYACKM